MGQAHTTDTPETRCATCRYWLERCCHALALAEGINKTPGACGHFTRMQPPPRQAGEVRPC